MQRPPAAAAQPPPEWELPLFTTGTTPAGADPVSSHAFPCSEVGVLELCPAGRAVQGKVGACSLPPLPNRHYLCNGADVTGKAQLQLCCRNSYVHPAMAAVCGGGGSLGVSCRGASRLQPSLAATPAPWSRAQRVKEGLGPPSSLPWVGCIGADLEGMVQCHRAGLDAPPAPGLVLGHSTAILGSSSLLYFRHYTPGTSSLGWVHASPGAASRQC